MPCRASSLTPFHTSTRRLRVEPRRRFVEEDHGWVPDEAHDDVQPTAHATRIRRRPAVRRVGEVETGQQVIGDLAGALQVPQAGPPGSGSLAR